MGLLDSELEDMFVTDPKTFPPFSKKGRPIAPNPVVSSSTAEVLCAFVRRTTRQSDVPELLEDPGCAARIAEILQEATRR
jgi:hypothetical protein